MMESSYDSFIAGKRIMAQPAGFAVKRSRLNGQLFDFQLDIVEWALRRGRAAIFADCGLGKTPMQLEWARHVVARTGGRVLILAPLAVSAQTQREGEKFGIPVTVCRTAADIDNGINITNYERLHHFAPSDFTGVVLDESSILKGFDGSTRKAITEFAGGMEFRLACTATPAPNDLIELTNHAEFLDVLSGKEIIALFFTQDGNTTHKWRLKGHARQAFWRWLASWSVAVRKPSDLGYDDGRFVLPPLTMHHDVVQCERTDGFLFPVDATSLADVRDAQRGTLESRVKICHELASIPISQEEPWVIWCNLNVEQDALEKLFGDRAISVYGSLTAEEKETRLLAWLTGERPILITKPSLAGFGLNMQRCSHVCFVGLSYSYEQFYQSIRRCWRFGQARPVDCHIVTAQTEGAVVASLERKEQQAAEMFEEIVGHMKGLQMDGATRQEVPYAEDVAEGDGWRLYLGDSVKQLAAVANDSVGLSVFSPPFPGMYTYTNSPHDMGNTRTFTEMIDQFKFLIPVLLRVTMPGRHCLLHLTQAVAFKGVDGYIGIKDFRGAVIAAMEAGGWIYYGETCIDKDPQVKAIRTKDRGLLFKSLANDSANMHMALADYLLDFRKPGDNPEPIRAGISQRYGNAEGWITADEWIEWAAPVWYRQTEHYPGGIKETEVLNVAAARDAQDERHLCPLQLGVIERAIKLWSNPGDLVCDPFAGVGSTGYKALQLRRRFVGCELKASYWRTAQKYLREAESERESGDLFATAR